jgi:hypothetical protein
MRTRESSVASAGKAKFATFCGFRLPPGTGVIVEGRQVRVAACSFVAGHPGNHSLLIEGQLGWLEIEVRL